MPKGNNLKIHSVTLIRLKFQNVCVLCSNFNNRSVPINLRNYELKDKCLPFTSSQYSMVKWGPNIYTKFPLPEKKEWKTLNNQRTIVWSPAELTLWSVPIINSPAKYLLIRPWFCSIGFVPWCIILYGPGPAILRDAFFPYSSWLSLRDCIYLRLV